MSHEVLRRPALAALGAAGALLLVVGCSATTAAGPEASSGSSAPIEIPSSDGPGVTADTITVSWGRGAFPSDDPEMQKQAQAAAAAVVAQFNEDGGIAGRDVVLADPDPSSELLAQRAQAYENNNFLPLPDVSNGKEACDAYADNDVFAVLFSPLVAQPYGTPAAAACLNEDGHPVIGVTSWSTSDFGRAPATAGLSIASERFYSALIAAGEDADFFTTDGKFALITDEAADDSILAAQLLPALADEGVREPQTFPLSAGASSADALNLAVKLKSAGFDHIIFAAQDSFPMAATLLPVMQQQDYYPELLSVDGVKLDILSIMGTVEMSSRLLDSAHTYVSQPNMDAAKLTDFQLSTPGGALFNEVITAHPELRPDPSLPDALTLLKAAIEGSGSEYVNAEAFSVGLNSLQDYQSMLFFNTRFDSERHDGGAGIVEVTFDSGCQCVSLSPDVVTF